MIGGILYCASSLSDFQGLVSVRAPVERAVLFVYPIFVLLIVSITKRSFSPITGLLMIGSYLGILIILFPEMHVSGNATLLGSSWVLCSAFLFALFIIFSAAAVREVGVIPFTSMYMLVSAMIVITLFVLCEQKTHAWKMSYGLAADIGAMSLFCTVFPAFLLSDAIRRIGAQLSTILSCLGPAITIWLDHAFLGSAVRMNDIIGSGVIVACTAVVSLREKRMDALPVKSPVLMPDTR